MMYCLLLGSESSLTHEEEDNEKIFAQALNTGFATPFQIDNLDDRQRILAGYYEGCGQLTPLFMKQIRTHGFVDRLLLIGTAGVGKSSLINLLAGKTIAEVNDGARSYTFTCDVYKINYGQYPIEITDVVGFDTYSESNCEMQRLETLKNLIRFVKRNSRGFTCVIFVMQKGRILNGFEKYYNTIFKHLLRSLPPAVLFLNGCESDDPLNDWLSRNRADIPENYKFGEIICGTTLNDGAASMIKDLPKKRSDTARMLWQKLEKYLQRRKPHPMQADADSVYKVWSLIQNGKQGLKSALAREERELIISEM